MAPVFEQFLHPSDAGKTRGGHENVAVNKLIAEWEDRNRQVTDYFGHNRHFWDLADGNIHSFLFGFSTILEFKRIE